MPSSGWSRQKTRAFNIAWHAAHYLNPHSTLEHYLCMRCLLQVQCGASVTSEYVVVSFVDVLVWNTTFAKLGRVSVVDFAAAGCTLKAVASCCTVQ
jgi:hypothetical protein